LNKVPLGTVKGNLIGPTKSWRSRPYYPAHEKSVLSCPGLSLLGIGGYRLAWTPRTTSVNIWPEAPDNSDQARTLHDQAPKKNGVITPDALSRRSLFLAGNLLHPFIQSDRIPTTESLPTLEGDRSSLWKGKYT
jgi:hypothetical protein